MAQLAALGVPHGNRFRRAGVGRDLRESTRLQVGEDDPIKREPREAVGPARTQGLNGTATNGNLVQGQVRGEGNPLPIRRNGRPLGAHGARQQVRVFFVEPAYVDLRALYGPGLIDQRRAVRRERQPPSRPQPRRASWPNRSENLASETLIATRRSSRVSRAL